MPDGGKTQWQVSGTQTSNRVGPAPGSLMVLVDHFALKGLSQTVGRTVSSQFDVLYASRVPCRTSACRVYSVAKSVAWVCGQRMNLRHVFANNLRAIRLEKGLSQERLADEAGLDRTYISSLERAVYSASLDVIEKIAAILKVEACILLLENHHSSDPGSKTPSCMQERLPEKK